MILVVFLTFFIIQSIFFHFSVWIYANTRNFGDLSKAFLLNYNFRLLKQETSPLNSVDHLISLRNAKRNILVNDNMLQLQDAI